MCPFCNKHTATHSLVGVPAQVLAIGRLQELLAVVLVLAAPVIRIDDVLHAGQFVARRRRDLLRSFAAFTSLSELAQAHSERERCVEETG